MHLCMLFIKIVSFLCKYFIHTYINKKKLWLPFRCFHVQFVVDPLIILKKKMSGSQPKKYHCPVCGKIFRSLMTFYDITILTPAKNLTNVLFVTVVILPRVNF